MPNGKLHRVTSGVAGGAMAALRARNQTPFRFAIETAGGSLAGILGGWAPDHLFDLPTSPNHRSVGHAVLPVGGSLLWYWQKLPAWQAHFRARADAVAAERADAEGLRRLWLRLVEAWNRLLAGAMAGFPAGYAMHLALDARTRRGLPLIW